MQTPLGMGLLLWITYHREIDKKQFSDTKAFIVAEFTQDHTKKLVYRNTDVIRRYGIVEQELLKRVDERRVR